MTQSVRQIVASETRAAHERLHRHPKIGRLTESTLAMPEYMSVLYSFCMIYRQAEVRRCALGFWPEFSLSNQCDALQADCNTTDPITDNPFSTVVSASQLLGVLYCLHGAQFGSSVIVKNLRATLPDAPIRYYSLGTRCELWRSLIAQMEAFGGQEGEVARIIQGAKNTFSHLDQASSKCLLGTARAKAKLRC